MATYYINADTGNDTTGAGTSVSPWATMAKAYSSSSANDTIYLQDSVNSYLFATTTGTRTGRSYVGQTKGKVILDGGGVDVNFRLGGDYNFTNMIFQNCIENGTGGSYGVFGYSNVAGAVGTVTFTDCVFRDMTLPDGVLNAQGGLLNNFAAASFTAVFTRCDIYNMRCFGLGSGGGLFKNTMTLTLESCNIAITDTSNYIKYIFAGYSSQITVTLRNTTISNFSGGTVTWTGATLIGSTVTYGNFYLITSMPSTSNSYTTNPYFVDVYNGNFSVRPAITVTSNLTDNGI